MRALTASNKISLAHESDFPLGCLIVSPSRRLVIAGDGSETLQPRIMQVLVALARRRGEVVPRDELMALCWGGFAVGDDAVHRCVARLRRLAEARGGFRLETVPRVGYQLVEAVTALGDAPDEAAVSAVPKADMRVDATRARFKSRHAMFFGVFAAGALAAAAMALLGAHLL